MTAPFPTTIQLGFGCASLGSRVDARQGLRSLAAAYHLGVNWFDLAPSYGDGRAEEVFAAFASGRREQIHICTKCGIAAQRVGRLVASVRPVAQLAVSVAPPLRAWIARAREPPARTPITGELIRSSLTESLRRLRTDHVDVLALHDPSEDDLARDDVARALEDVVRGGEARIAGVAGAPERAVEAVRRRLPIGLVQFANNLNVKGLEQVRGALGDSISGLLVVTHSVFDPLRRLSSLGAERSSEMRRDLEELGYRGPLGQAAGAALMDYALGCNPHGVVLASMFDRAHLEANVARTKAQAPNPDTIESVFALYIGGPRGPGPGKAS